MSIDLERERLSLNEVAQLLDKNLSTVWRWCLTGIKRDGVRVKLPSIVIGGRRYVFRDDLDDFLGALNSDDPTPTKPSAKAKRRADAAADKLDSIGIGN